MAGTQNRRCIFGWILGERCENRTRTPSLFEEACFPQRRHSTIFWTRSLAGKLAHTSQQTSWALNHTCFTASLKVTCLPDASKFNLNHFLSFWITNWNYVLCLLEGSGLCWYNGTNAGPSVTVGHKPQNTTWVSFHALHAYPLVKIWVWWNHFSSLHQVFKNHVTSI